MNFIRQLKNIRIQGFKPGEYDAIQYLIHEFCLDSEITTHSLNDWENNPASLMHVMYKQRRYDSGIVCMAFDNDIPISFSACHAYPLPTDKTVLIGSRTHTKLKYEHLRLGIYTSGMQVLWAKENGFLKMFSSFNMHNDRLMDILKTRHENIKKRLANADLSWPIDKAEYALQNIYHTPQHTLTYNL
jgi:hypothetical protein